MYARYENEANHFENSVLAHTASTNPHPRVGVRKLDFSVQFSKAKLSYSPRMCSAPRIVFRQLLSLEQNTFLKQEQKI